MPAFLFSVTATTRPLTRQSIGPEYDFEVSNISVRAMPKNGQEFQPLRAGVKVAVAFVAMTAAYTVIFSLTGDDRLIDDLTDAIINVTPLTALAIGAFALNRSILLAWPPAVQWPLHILIAFAFAAIWYFLVTVLLGWRAGDFSGGFSVRPFSSIAFIWQMFQGAILYALVVAVALIAELRERLAGQTPRSVDTQLPANHSGRLLIRGEDDWSTVAVDDIISISRAGDYAQIVTRQERRLVRRSLADLLEQLPVDRFLRIHRSHLINLDAMESAESIGGGRLRVRLIGGTQIDTSRPGARMLKERAG